MPSISVIIPSYNYESYMYEAIKSVLLQSLKDFELIIVDDGSTDDSVPLRDKINESLCYNIRMEKIMAWRQLCSLELLNPKVNT